MTPSGPWASPCCSRRWTRARGGVATSLPRPRARAGTPPPMRRATCQSGMVTGSEHNDTITCSHVCTHIVLVQLSCRLTNASGWLCKSTRSRAPAAAARAKGKAKGKKPPSRTRTAHRQPHTWLAAAWRSGPRRSLASPSRPPPGLCYSRSLHTRETGVGSSTAGGVSRLFTLVV